MKTNILVTFALFSYNQEKYIKDAVESAFSQTYSPLEIIISDDNSTDSTFEIIQNLVEKYQGDHLIVLNRNTQNLGICNHINYIWQLARGQWIVQAAGDDISHNDRVSSIMQLVNLNPKLKLIQSFLNVVDHEGTFLNVYTTLHNLKNTSSEQKTYSWSIQNRIDGLAPHTHGASMAYSREIIDNFPKLPEDCIYEDSIVDFRAELIGMSALIERSLVSYRVNDSQITNVYSKDVMKNYVKKINNHFYLMRAVQQNIIDFNIAMSSNLIDLNNNLIDNIDKWLKIRLRFFSDLHKSLSKPWPLRILYLIRSLCYQYDYYTFNRDIIYQSVLPQKIYFFVKTYLGKYRIK